MIAVVQMNCTETIDPVDRRSQILDLCRIGVQPRARLLIQGHSTRRMLTTCLEGYIRLLTAGIEGEPVSTRRPHWRWWSTALRKHRNTPISGLRLVPTHCVVRPQPAMVLFEYYVLSNDFPGYCRMQNSTNGTSQRWYGSRAVPENRSG